MSNLKITAKVTITEFNEDGSVKQVRESTSEPRFVSMEEIVNGNTA
jgi:hypothetical protein